MALFGTRIPQAQPDREQRRVCGPAATEEVSARDRSAIFDALAD